MGRKNILRSISIASFMWVVFFIFQNATAVDIVKEHEESPAAMETETGLKKVDEGPLLHPITGVPVDPESGITLDDATGEIVDEFGLIVRLSESMDKCIKCHYNKEKYEELILLWDVSHHSAKQVICTKCHGGNLSSETIKEAKGEGTMFIHIKTPLADLKGEEISKTAFQYCGQCHGTIFRDWEAGIHGKRIGYWNGEKEFWTCVKCHDAHNPKFKKLKPKAPPIKPHEIEWKAGH